MADEQNKQQLRSDQAPGHAGASAASDPLAELARLIGQSDPFAEFARENKRSAPPTQEAPPVQAPPAGESPLPQASPVSAPSVQAGAAADAAADFIPPPVARRPAPPPKPLPIPNFERQPVAANFARPGEGATSFERPPFNPPPRAAATDFDAARASGIAEAPEEIAAHPDDSYHQDEAPAGAEADVYDDVPPRRRVGIMAVAAVLALALIGTAGAFGYRAMFGKSGSSGPPPVIKAETTPSKIVPSAAKTDAQQAKLSYDRVGDQSAGEKMVSREEKPVAITTKPDVMPASPSEPARTASLQPGLANGVVAGEPKKVHTIVIHPDDLAASKPAPEGAPETAATPPAAAAPAEPEAPAAATAPSPAVTATSATVPEPPPPPPQHRTVSRSLAPVQHTAQVATAAPNAPLSLNPNAPAPRNVAPAARTMAAVPPARTAARTTSTGGHSYAVQLSSQRSEADAQAAFQKMKAKYPSQLGSREVLIRKVDLGARGTYYRAMVGPFGNPGEAGKLCSSLKAAGGKCFVQKI